MPGFMPSFLIRGVPEYPGVCLRVEMFKSLKTGYTMISIRPSYLPFQLLNASTFQLSSLSTAYPPQFTRYSRGFGAKKSHTG